MAIRLDSAVRQSALLSLAVAVLLSAARAGASDEAPSLEARIDAPPDRSTLLQRPFAFVVDPSAPGEGHLALSVDLGMGSGIAADRPLPVTLAAPSAATTVGASYGLTGHVAAYANAIAHQEGAASASAGITVRLTRPTAPLRATISAGGLHEGLTGANGATFLAAVSLDQGPVRLAANVSGEKMLTGGRDRLDVVALAGGSVRVARQVRVGGEWVSQDVEETLSDGAEGGARHAVGPDVAFELGGGRYQLSLATLFGVTPASPRALFRAGLSYNY